MKICIYNPTTNRSRCIKWGVSWLYLFFGGWAAVFQRQWALVVVEVVLTALVNITKSSEGSFSITCAVALALFHVLMFFSGNKIYARYLVSKGWQPADDMSRSVLGR